MLMPEGISQRNSKSHTEKCLKTWHFSSGFEIPQSGIMENSEKQMEMEHGNTRTDKGKNEN